MGVYASRLCEEVAAAHVEDDRHEGLEPAVRLRNGLLRSAEGKRDGVSCLES